MAHAYTPGLKVTRLTHLERDRRLPLKGDVESKDVTVRTEVPQDGAQPITVYYRMHLNDDGWKVYDVTVDGVSLVTTYRSSFGQLVKTGGMAINLSASAIQNA